MSSPDRDIHERPLLLLDGMSLAFRAFFALSTDIATSAGLVTNSLHGFASMMHSLVRSQRPRALAVAFDLPGGTFRDDMTVDYKGGRAETPVEIEHQFALIRSLCDVLHIPVVSVERFEADDVLATLATWGRDAQIPVVVVTGDRDSFQLVEDPYVRVLYNRRGVSDYDLYDEAGIFERCGIEPQRYPLLAALRGDASDNLPGVPGVGEKTAAKLFAQYRDFDDLYQHLGDLTPKLRENLATYEARARQNERVMQLVRDVPLAVTLDDIHMGGWNPQEVGAFFDRYEMSAMRRRYESLMKEGLFGPAATSSREVRPVSASPANVTKRVAELTTLEGESVFCVRQGERIVLIDHANQGLITSVDEFLSWASFKRISGHDIKAIYRDAFEHGVILGPPTDDIALMGFLIDSSSGRYGIEDLALKYLEESLDEARPSLFDANADDDRLWALAMMARRIDVVLRAQILEWDLTRVYRDIELPLAVVLARMEVRGICVDVAMLRRIAEEFASEAVELDAQIQAAAGHGFKVNSPQQLQVILFEELGLTPGKKIKTGFSTDATTLEAIVDQHPIVSQILRYREVEKLRSTYGAPLIATVAADGRIHATFHQTVARTGRLSSEMPNLHNIPVRSADGRRLRYAFVPSAHWEFAVADYNQIELRLLAHLSHDEGLMAAFAGGRDVHRAIAATVFHIGADEVDHDQREKAKAVSYGLAYGMEAYGLSQRLAIPVSEAKAIIDQYFAGFPHLRAYMDKTVAEIRQSGYSRTEFGRIRPFPDLMTASGPARQAAERQAINAGIQGLAADIFKLALVRLDRGLSQAQLEARLVLQVHDEVIVESPPHEHTRVEKVIREALTGVVELSVPLEISLNWGASWAEAKG